MPTDMPNGNRYTHALHEAVTETVQRLSAAQKPLIIAGVEVHRFGLQDEVIHLGRTSQDSDRGNHVGQKRGGRTAPVVCRCL